ncbi:MAG: ribbon-helix-helix domain-containing protein [Alphaproteobacteria bacterium]|jgi:predicted DNA-binding ribbon-helix-helix protein
MPGDDDVDDHDEAELLRRSFRVAGHQTSLSMERAFWDELRCLAHGDGRTMTALIAEIDAERTAGLSRAVRVYILKRLRAGN